MVERITNLGLKPHVLHGVERTVVAAIGPELDGLKESLESGVGVAEVLPILAPYKVASREVKAEPTVVRAGSLTVGGGTIGVIAGPMLGRNRRAIVSQPPERAKRPAPRRCAAGLSNRARAPTASRD